VKKYPHNPCLGHRPIKYGEAQAYKWLSYKETGELVDAAASGAMSLGLKAHGRVGVYGINCPEWMIAMQVVAGSRLAHRHNSQESGHLSTPTALPCKRFLRERILVRLALEAAKPEREAGATFTFQCC
jgi:hypothetical protein